MAEFTPSKKTAQDFNEGVEYIDGDAELGITGDSVKAESINNVIEGFLYTQGLAANQPDVSEANQVDTVSVTIITAADGSARLKFSNLKGEQGVGISTITPNGTDANGGNKYKITLDDGRTFDFVAPKGAKGDTGNGIVSTVITYATGDSGITAPAIGWQSSIPDVEKGNYLWTRTVNTYTNGSSTTSYSSAYQGVNGDQGRAGGVRAYGTLFNDSNIAADVVISVLGIVDDYPYIYNGDLILISSGDSRGNLYQYLGDTVSFNSGSLTISNAIKIGSIIGTIGDSGAIHYVVTDARTVGSSANTYDFSGIIYSQSSEPILNKIYIVLYAGTDENRIGNLYRGTYKGMTVTETGTVIHMEAVQYLTSLRGKSGQDGNGISSMTIRYSISESGTEIPPFFDYQNIPEVPQGKYLWAKIQTYYTNNSVDNPKYIVSYQGKDGNVSSVNSKTGAVTLNASDVGAMGVNGSTGNVDLNTVVQNGTYYVSYEAINKPDNNKGYGEMFVASNEDTVAQIYVHYNTGDVYVRSSWKSTEHWTDWKQLMPTSGGKFTGRVGFSSGAALPNEGVLPYFLGIQAFADGGNMIYRTASDVLGDLGGMPKSGGAFTGAVTSAVDGNGFISHTDEFNFCSNLGANFVTVNYRGTNGKTIQYYQFCNGDSAGGLADIKAKNIYDNNQRVYSPNNKQPIYLHRVSITVVGASTGNVFLWIYSSSPDPLNLTKFFNYLKTRNSTGTKTAYPARGYIKGSPTMNVDGVYVSGTTPLGSAITLCNGQTDLRLNASVTYGDISDSVNDNTTI